MVVVSPGRADEPRLVFADAATLAPHEVLEAIGVGASFDVAVLAPTLETPVAYAQRLHQLDRTVAVVVVSEPARLAALAQAVLIAPFVGLDVTCRSVDDELLAAEVAEIAERTAQRRRFRATLESASAQLAAASAQGSTQVGRVAGRFLDDAPLAVVAVSQEGTVAGWNRRAAELFGRGERDVLGQSFALLLPPASRPPLRELLSRPTRVDGEPATATLEYDGQAGRRFLDVTASALPTPAGAGAAVLLMLRDDTARVVAEHERETARAELAFLVDAGAALVAPTRLEETLDVLARVAVPAFADACLVEVVEDGELRRVAVSGRDDAMIAVLGELRRRYPPTWESPQPAARALRAREPILLQIETEEAARALCFDDEHHALIARVDPVSTIATPLAARGHTLGALTFIRARGSERYNERDVELARRVGERASIALDNVRLLKEAQERARAARVLAAVADGVFLLDRNGRVLLWNPAAERITGIESGAVVGRPLSEVVPAWTAVAAAVPVSAPEEPPRPATLPLDVGATEIWISVAGVATGEGTVYAFRDTTQEVAVERLKSDFVATVSHELRTPLASVYGAALTLERPEIAADDERRRELTRVIVDEGARLARLVDDILLASQLDAAAVGVSSEPVDLGDVARAAVEAARTGLAASRQIVVHGEGRSIVVGDADRIRQVVGNLIENALKYSPPEAPVEVEVEVDVRAARLWVRDEGIGIRPHEQERIFEKFYRADPYLARSVSGTGLGLYISRELIRQMGGRIGVEPREGGGSSFFVELPRPA